MASSLATQLSQIAARSTHQLDLKAQKAAHAQSLIFDKAVAGSQTFDTIFFFCNSGFLELCALDPKFKKFQRNLFSPQSQTQNRLHMNKHENEQLDAVVDQFLVLVSARLLLSPAVKAVDWLIRRFRYDLSPSPRRAYAEQFRIHEYNTSTLLLAFLPYHTTPLFLNVLSLVPNTIPPALKVLNPYKRSLTSPPRHPLVHSATTNRQFFSAFNNHVFHVCREGGAYQGLMSFWAGITTEAVAGMLDSARSGRSEVEKRNLEDVLLRVFPLIHTGLSLNNVPDMVVSCFLVCIVVATKAQLGDQVLDSLMEAAAGSWTEATFIDGIICLSVLAHQKQTKSLRPIVVKNVLRLDNSIDVLQDIRKRYPIDGLLVGLVQGCLADVEKQGDGSRLEYIENLFQRDLLTRDGTVQAMMVLATSADRILKSNDLSEDTRAKFSNIIHSFNESEQLLSAFREAVTKARVDFDALEMGFQTIIQSNEDAPVDEDIEMEDSSEHEQKANVIAQMFEFASNQNLKDPSFLAPSNSSVFYKLAELFGLIWTDNARLSAFIKLSIISKDPVSFFSFFVRFFSNPYLPTARVTAINTVASKLSDEFKKRPEVQILLPFIIAALGDPSDSIRRAACGLLTAFASCLPKPKGDEDKSDSSYLENIYGKDVKVESLLPRDLHKITHRALIPALEEYVLEPNQIAEALEAALRGHPKSGEKNSEEKPESGALELKKSARLSLFSFLASHAIVMPIYAVKLRLLLILNRIGKIGSTTRTQELAPLLQAWPSVHAEDASEIASREKININELDEQVAFIVTAKQKDAIDMLLSIVATKPGTRSDFVSAVFTRVTEIWPSVEPDRQVSVADSLLGMAVGQGPFPELTDYAREALELVDLSGPVLSSFLNKISLAVTEIDSHSPATKRRRTGHSNAISLSSLDPKETNQLIRNMTFILELVDGSRPEEHPDLLGSLFRALAALHHLKQQLQSEMSYLLGLVLGIMLSVVNTLKESPKPKFDPNIIRADIVIDCVRTSESPQVQNTALLLIASLATIASESVLHSVMPIFTFMGSSVLWKDDEYSALVVDQTIDQVVPPLIRSLRSQNRDVFSGTSELLLSFTAAFEHIPSHRRLRLFRALVSKLGPDDFLFAVLAMLANRYGLSKDVLSLTTSLTTEFGPELQLITYIKSLALVQDTFHPKPSLSRTLLGVGGDEGEEPVQIAVKVLKSLAYVIKHASLGSKMSKAFKAEDEEASKINSLYSEILNLVLRLCDAVKTLPVVADAAGSVLSSLLGTLSLIDLVDTIIVLMERHEDDIRRRMLRLLEARLNLGHERDVPTQVRMLEFLGDLAKILKTSSDMQLKHAAVACIARIVDLYGKKGPGQVIETAHVIAGADCLNQKNDRLHVMGILCLASMAEVLKESMIPIFPSAVPRALDLLQASLQPDEENPQLHDAAFSFISVLLIHIPYMVTEFYLDRIFALSFKSAAASLPDECDDNRREVLELLAKRVDVDETFRATESGWDAAVTEGPEAVKELLSVIGTAIDRHPKSATIKSLPVLTKLLRKGLDIRRVHYNPDDEDAVYDESEIEKLENQVGSVTIKMIFKLNDAIFRPLFIQLTEWATKEVDETESRRRFRLSTFYSFAETFFGTLKVCLRTRKFE